MISSFSSIQGWAVTPSPNLASNQYSLENHHRSFSLLPSQAVRHHPERGMATGQGEGGHLCCHKLGSSTKTECRILSTKRSVSQVTRKQLWFIEIKR